MSRNTTDPSDRENMTYGEASAPSPPPAVRHHKVNEQSYRWKSTVQTHTCNGQGMLDHQLRPLVHPVYLSRSAENLECACLLLAELGELFRFGGFYLVIL
jgi:hypothetical protein